MERGCLWCIMRGEHVDAVPGGRLCPVCLVKHEEELAALARAQLDYGAVSLEDEAA